jgi:hypothetical protein
MLSKRVQPDKVTDLWLHLHEILKRDKSVMMAEQVIGFQRVGVQKESKTPVRQCQRVWKMELFCILIVVEFTYDHRYV